MESGMRDIENINSAVCSSPCLFCGPTEIEVLCLKGRHGEHLRTVICRGCGLIWSDPRPDDQELKTFYSHNYRLEYKGLTRPQKKHVYRDAVEAMRRYRFVKGLLQPKDTLLDVGAGTGVFVCYLRKLGFNACGIGTCENHSRYARDILKVPVRTGFCRDVDGKKSYNIITLHHVLEHMADPLAELKHLWCLLQDDGHLVVDVPNAEDIRQDPGNRYHKAHIYSFNPETLAALGITAGFVPYLQTIAPLNGNITIIFKKQRETAPNPINLRNNFSKITTILNEHTPFRHFTSMTPYKKLAENALAALTEQLMIRKFRTDLEIIDAVISFEKR